MSGWQAAGGPSPHDRLTLELIRADWSPFYDAGYVDGTYAAMRIAGGDLLSADTPEGLDSAIRADWKRHAKPSAPPWGTQ